MTEDKHRLELQVAGLGADVQRLEEAASDLSKRAEEGRRAGETEQREWGQRLDRELGKKDEEIQVWSGKKKVLVGCRHFRYVVLRPRFLGSCCCRV